MDNISTEEYRVNFNKSPLQRQISMNQKHSLTNRDKTDLKLQNLITGSTKTDWKQV